MNNDKKLENLVLVCIFRDLVEKKLISREKFYVFLEKIGKI